jgi:O-phospho-L-seryl-tRNASec:L-selenocysteinyl-tRNA synthase
LVYNLTFIVLSPNKQLIKEVNTNYSGRASISAVLDLFVSFLQVSISGYKLLLKERKSNFQFLLEKVSSWAKLNDEKVIQSERNKISIALTLKKLPVGSAKDLGAFLYHTGVMGGRVVELSDQPKEFGNDLKYFNFGGHINDESYEGFPYITIAAAIGSHKNEIETFIKRFDKVYQKIKNKSK